MKRVAIYLFFKFYRVRKKNNNSGHVRNEITYRRKDTITRFRANAVFARPFGDKTLLEAQRGIAFFHSNAKPTRDVPDAVKSER